LNVVGTTWRRLLAEGVVIVLGVLIALAVDRYAQGIDDRRLEQQYLAQLLDEFEQIHEMLENSAHFAETRQGYTEVVLLAMDGTVADTLDARG